MIVILGCPHCQEQAMDSRPKGLIRCQETLGGRLIFLRLEVYATPSVPPFGRRFSRATKLTYRIPAIYRQQYKKPLVNSKKIDLTLVIDY